MGTIIVKQDKEDKGLTHMKKAQLTISNVETKIVIGSLKGLRTVELHNKRTIIVKRQRIHTFALR